METFHSLFIKDFLNKLNDASSQISSWPNNRRGNGPVIPIIKAEAEWVNFKQVIYLQGPQSLVPS